MRSKQTHGRIEHTHTTQLQSCEGSNRVPMRSTQVENMKIHKRGRWGRWLQILVKKTTKSMGMEPSQTPAIYNHLLIIHCWSMLTAFHLNAAGRPLFPFVFLFVFEFRRWDSTAADSHLTIRPIQSHICVAHSSVLTSHAFQRSHNSRMKSRQSNMCWNSIRCDRHFRTWHESSTSATAFNYRHTSKGYATNSNSCELLRCHVSASSAFSVAYSIVVWLADSHWLIHSFIRSSFNLAKGQHSHHMHFTAECCINQSTHITSLCFCFFRRW